MQNNIMDDKLDALLIHFFNAWINLLSQYWYIPGMVFGISITLAFLNRNNRLMNPLLGVTFLSFIFQPGLYFSIPYVARQIAGTDYHLRSFYLWSFIGEAGFIVIIVWLAVRYLSPSFEIFVSRFTKASRTERNRRTDIRQINVHLPNSQKAYDPSKYFNSGKGMFFGLNEYRKPVYIPWGKWRKSHSDVIGTTGSGKGVAAGVLLAQAALSGESVVVVDPKNDEWLPHVMRKAAENAGVPYVFLDLQADQPQWNPVQNKNINEIEELFSAGFSLGEKGTDADVYRLGDRKAARVFANMAHIGNHSLIEMLQQLLQQQQEVAEAGKKFISDLEEIGLVPAVNTSKGIDLAGLIKQGAVIYVRGSMRNPRILKLQRIFVLSLMQHIEARPRSLGNGQPSRHVCLFMDEFKYLVSRPTLEALGAIRDKNAHVVIAHQSLGDLRDCPNDLDAQSVVASVNENCALKLAYQVKDPDTAEWLARMSGTILVDDEARQVKTNVGLTEVRDGERTLKQAERPLVDTNMLQALPERCAVLYGAGLAQFVFTSPMKVMQTQEAIEPVIISGVTQPSSRYQETSTNDVIRGKGNIPPTFGQRLLDVD